MAHLEIQEKKSSNWMWWVIGLVLLALLAWWLLSRNDGDEVVNSAAGVTQAPAAAPTDAGVITDLGTLTGNTDANAMMGRRVALMGVPVSEAVSDKGFWLGSGTGVGQGVFAVRTNQMQANTAADGAVTAGRNANVWGMITAMPTNLSAETATWNLRSTDTEALGAHRFYILADSVRLAQ